MLSRLLLKGSPNWFPFHYHRLNAAGLDEVRAKTAAKYHDDEGEDAAAAKQSRLKLQGYQALASADADDDSAPRVASGRRSDGNDGDGPPSKKGKKQRKEAAVAATGAEDAAEEEQPKKKKKKRAEAAAAEASAAAQPGKKKTKI